MAAEHFLVCGMQEIPPPRKKNSLVLSKSNQVLSSKVARHKISGGDTKQLN